MVSDDAILSILSNSSSFLQIKDISCSPTKTWTIKTTREVLIKKFLLFTHATNLESFNNAGSLYICMTDNSQGDVQSIIHSRTLLNPTIIIGMNSLADLRYRSESQ